MNNQEEKQLITAVELMSNDKIYALFEILLDEINKRKVKRNGTS